MMRAARQIFLIITMALVVFLCKFASAEGDAIPSIKYLSDVSQVIVVGQIRLTASSTGVQLALLDVARVIKGEVEPGQLSITLPSCAASNVPDAIAYGVWFLAKMNGSTVGFPASPKHQVCPELLSLIAIPAGPLPGPWSYPSDLPTADKLAYELGYSVESASTTQPEILKLNDDAFHGASKATLQRVMGRLAGSSNPEASFVGFRGLVEDGNPTALLQTQRNWKNVICASGNSSDGIAHSAIRRMLILRAMRHIDASEGSTVDALSRIAADSSLETDLRAAAAEPLRNVHSAQALATLGPLLNDDNESIREEAIAGVACYANAVPPLDVASGGRGLELSHHNSFTNSDTIMHFAFGHISIFPREGYFLSYWKQWWQENSAAVLASY